VRTVFKSVDIRFNEECVLCVPSDWLGKSLLNSALYCCLEQA